MYRASAPKKITATNPNLSTLLNNASSHNVVQNVTKQMLNGVGGTPFLTFGKSGLLEDGEDPQGVIPHIGPSSTIPKSAHYI